MKTLVDESIRGLFVEPLRPSPLEKLLELKPSALERVDGPADHDGGRDRGEDDKDQVRVLARWNNPAAVAGGDRAIVGDGRVLFWTTTADRAGNDWPIEPSFVLAVREAVRGTARPTRFDNTVTAGERMRRVVHSSQQISNARLTSPGGGEPRSLPVVPLGEEPGDRGPAVEITVPDTRLAGVVPARLGRRVRSGRSKTSTRPTPTRAKARSSGSRASELKSMLEPLEVEIVDAARRRLRSLRRDRPRDLARPGRGAARAS